MKIIFCHILDEHNLGDQVCCPMDYVPIKDGSEFVEMDIREDPEKFTADSIVFGGGGLFHYGVDVMMQKISEAARRKNPHVKLICWGPGTNYHGKTDAYWPPFLSGFDLVGLRDRGNPYHWVPCASCLHPFFDQVTTAPTHEYVVYSHHQHPLKIDGPTMTNDRPKDQFLPVLEFLSSGRIILTNTFHGAYWGLMLGRAVIIIEPFSNRFFHGFPTDMSYAETDTWQGVACDVTPLTDPEQYLVDCRVANYSFMKLVAETLAGIL